MDQREDPRGLRGGLAGEPEVLCWCAGYSRDELRGLILERGWRSLEDVLAHIPAGAGCSCCRPELEALLSEVHAPPPAEPEPPKP
jgi:NAD(P)H-nitrite reductase large subunit